MAKINFALARERPPRFIRATDRPVGAPKFDPDDFYGIAGDIVHELIPWTEADPVAVYASILTTAGVLISPSFFGQVGSKRHAPRLFLCIFGSTGSGRKGTAQAEVRMVFELALPNIPVSSYARGGINTAEGLMDNFNGVSVPPRRMLAIENEFGRLLTLSARDGNVISHAMRELWDGEEVQNSTRKHPIDIHDANLGMIVSVTAEELETRLDQVDVYNGMANRFLWVFTHRGRLIADPPHVPHRIIEPLAVKLGERIMAARGMGRVKRDENAIRLWERGYVKGAWVERPPRIAAVTERREAQQLRMQLIFAALDGSDVIERAHVKAAAQLWTYCEQSAAYLFAASTGNKRLDKILAALRVAHGRRLTRGAIRKDVFKDNIAAAELDQLAMAGEEWIEIVEGETGAAGGRPPELWSLRMG